MMREAGVTGLLEVMPARLGLVRRFAASREAFARVLEDFDLVAFAIAFSKKSGFSVTFGCIGGIRGGYLRKRQRPCAPADRLIRRATISLSQGIYDGGNSLS
jgi:hypothetical protein